MDTLLSAIRHEHGREVIPLLSFAHDYTSAAFHHFASPYSAIRVVVKLQKSFYVACLTETRIVFVPTFHIEKRGLGVKGKSVRTSRKTILDLLEKLPGS